MKKFLMALVAVIFLSGCNYRYRVLLVRESTSATATETAENTVVAEPTTESSIVSEDTKGTVLTMGDYEYEVYGRIHGLHTLIGNPEVAVGAFEPIQKGGEENDDYGWGTVFVDVETIGRDSDYINAGVQHWRGGEDHYYRLTVKNCQDGGGFIDLPEYVVGLEEISVEDIPFWGGM